jgi:hypothetical protein
MSVIGRLDEQVNAVLITPLEKRGAHKEDAPTRDARTHDRPVPSSETKGQETGGDNKMSEQEPLARPRELPVWLL